MKKKIYSSQSIARAPKILQRFRGKLSVVLLLETAIFIILGAAVFFWPTDMVSYLGIVFGTGLAANGAYKIYQTIKDDQKHIAKKTLDISFGVIKFIAGIVLLTHPAGKVSSILYVFAIFFLFKSVNNIVITIRMRTAGHRYYTQSAILSVLMTIGAVLVLFIPETDIIVAMHYITGVLIFYSLTNIYMYFLLHRLKHFYPLLY